MAGVNPGGISRLNIGITWGHGWMALLAKHTKLIILCLLAKKLIYHVINQAKMVILWVNIGVRSPPSWNPFFGTTWLRFYSRLRFRTRARNPVGPRPDFGDSAHRQIWRPNVNNKIYILTHEYSSTGFEKRLVFKIIKFGESEVEIPPFCRRNLAIKKTVRKPLSLKQKPPSVFLCRKVFYA